jgi:hypothetical protein
VTRDKAAQRIAKLDAVAAPGSGATPNERHVAQSKAAHLRAQHNLPRTPAPPAPPSGSGAGGVRTSRTRPSRPPRTPGPTYTAPMTGAAWAFNVQTQQHSPNVRVKHYTNRANWSIEITDW